MGQESSAWDVDSGRSQANLDQASALSPAEVKQRDGRGMTEYIDLTLS
jgi:hypothetical protein